MMGTKPTAKRTTSPTAAGPAMQNWRTRSSESAPACGHDSSTPQTAYPHLSTVRLGRYPSFAWWPRRGRRGHPCYTAVQADRIRAADRCSQADAPGCVALKPSRTLNSWDTAPWAGQHTYPIRLTSIRTLSLCDGPLRSRSVGCSGSGLTSKASSNSITSCAGLSSVWCPF